MLHKYINSVMMSLFFAGMRGELLFVRYTRNGVLVVGLQRQAQACTCAPIALSTYLKQPRNVNLSHSSSLLATSLTINHIIIASN